MKKDPSKSLKHMIHVWAGKAHDEELNRALAKLAEAFQQWENGSLSGAELNDRIHRFHQDESRDSYLRYATNRPEAPLPHAIATGVIERAKVPPEVLEHLAGLIQMYEQDLSSL